MRSRRRLGEMIVLVLFAAAPGDCKNLGDVVSATYVSY